MTNLTFKYRILNEEQKKYIIFMESIHGILSESIKGLDREEKWSDLWYIFKPKGFEKTLAEMDNKEREERRKKL